MGLYMWRSVQPTKVEHVNTYSSGTRAVTTPAGVLLRMEYHTGDVVHFDDSGRVQSVVTPDGKVWK